MASTPGCNSWSQQRSRRLPNPPHLASPHLLPVAIPIATSLQRRAPARLPPSPPFPCFLQFPVAASLLHCFAATAAPPARASSSHPPQLDELTDAILLQICRCHLAPPTPLTPFSAQG
ncbi:hypothetical protein BRADI_3g09015v3 [Brachypodium distachyon]|uniref:Uncharacterized protein n=1 Tax=Brachypodium distachyon TaxID=15368 RepID=A0A0Q3J7S2_BRADI|nr:hypothetical protein BRADI_3g09015v3 [Brachypodium distachyon]